MDEKYKSLAIGEKEMFVSAVTDPFLVFQMQANLQGNVVNC